MRLGIDTDNIMDRDLFGEIVRQQFFDNENLPKVKNEYKTF